MRGLALIATVLAVGAAPAANGSIAYVVRGAIWAVSVDGGTAQKLRNGAWPDWSPDGRRLVYQDVLRRGLFVMTANGTGPRRITTGFDFQPAWSPEGKRVVFARNVPGYHSDIYVVNADGTGLRRLTRNRVQDTDPAWAPDGTRIAFAEVGAARYAKPWIMTISPTGSALRRVGVGGSPDWSPDGLRFLFVGYPGGVWTMDVDGTHRTRLAEQGTRPVWSPDGQRIAYESSEGSPTEQSSVWVMAVDGSAPTRLTRPPSGEPTWQPLR